MGMEFYDGSKLLTHFHSFFNRLTTYASLSTSLKEKGVRMTRLDHSIPGLPCVLNIRNSGLTLLLSLMT